LGKNHLVEELDEKVGDFVYIDSDDSKEVLQGDNNVTLFI
jgi:hypothetical protein